MNQSSCKSYTHTVVCTGCRKCGDQRGDTIFILNRYQKLSYLHYTTKCHHCSISYWVGVDPITLDEFYKLCVSDYLCGRFYSSDTSIQKFCIELLQELENLWNKDVKKL